MVCHPSYRAKGGSRGLSAMMSLIQGIVDTSISKGIRALSHDICTFSSLALLSHTPVTLFIQPPFQDDIVDVMVCRSLVVFSTFGMIVSLFSSPRSRHSFSGLGVPLQVFSYHPDHPSPFHWFPIRDVKNVLRCGHQKCDKPQYLMIDVVTGPLTIGTQAQSNDSFSLHRCVITTSVV